MNTPTHTPTDPDTDLVQHVLEQHRNRQRLARLLRKSKKTFPSLVLSSAYTPEHAHLQAETGAAYMDVHCPGWAETTDWFRLDLSYGDSCVLGQQAHCLTKGKVESNNLESYWQTVERLAKSSVRRVTGTDAEYDAIDVWAIQRGFTIPLPSYSYMPGNSTRYEMLTIAWKEQIRARGLAHQKRIESNV